MARQVDNWLREYIHFTASMEAPDTFHFWAGVSTIAGALRRKVWLDMGHFQWTPNFYIIFVAPPGIVSKSTTLGVGMSMLKELKEIKFGPDSVTWQALTVALANARVDFPLNGAFVPMSAITIFSSEFGTFLNPHDREMIDVLVDLWDNRIGTWEKVTKLSGSEQIVNPWINIAACTTPAWISGNFPDYMVGGGFTSRCVFVYAEKKRKLIAYPFLEMEEEDRLARRDKLVKDLGQIAALAGQFRLSPEAIKVGVAWYEGHYENINKELNNAQFAGYLARKQTHIHKLAMILSAAESDSLVITDVHLNQAIAIITSLEMDMPKVFSTIGQQGDAKNASLVLDIIKAYGKISRLDLFRLVASRMSVPEFDTAIDSGIHAQYIKAYSNGQTPIYVFNEPEERKPSGSDSKE